MRKLSLALAVSLGVGLFAACSPSIDAAAKADVDHRVATLSPAGQNVDKPSNATPMPMAVGQWLTYKVLSDKGEPSFLTLQPSSWIFPRTAATWSTAPCLPAWMSSGG